MADQNNRTLRLIAGFKFLNGILLVILGLGLLRLVNRDVGEVLEHWINRLRIDPENRHAVALLSGADHVTKRQLEEFSGLTFVYAALFLTEGTGLYLRKLWAEWLTLIATGSFIPLEIYEVHKHCTVIKVALLAVNTGIVAYLGWRIRVRGVA